MTSLIDFDKRPVVDMSALCVPIPGFPKSLSFTLPGGVRIDPQVGHLQLGAFEYTRNALGMMNAALAPMGPAFRIIDAVMSISKCLSAVPEILGPPPNPQKLVDELIKLAEKMKFVAQLHPALSLPVMVLNLIDVFIATLEAAASELESLARFLLSIQQAQLVAAQAEGLTQIIKCAQSSADVHMSNLEHMFATINPTIQAINLFAEIGQLGKPFPIPEFTGVMPPEPLIAAHTLRETANAIRVIREAIPF